MVSGNDIKIPNRLTPRQYEVLLLLAKGYTNDEIAEKLFITNHTVKAHICEIFSTYKVSSRLQAVIKALKENALKLDDIDL